MTRLQDKKSVSILDHSKRVQYFRALKQGNNMKSTKPIYTFRSSNVNQ